MIQSELCVTCNGKGIVCRFNVVILDNLETTTGEVLNILAFCRARSIVDYIVLCRQFNINIRSRWIKDETERCFSLDYAVVLCIRTIERDESAVVSGFCFANDDFFHCSRRISFPLLGLIVERLDFELCVVYSVVHCTIIFGEGDLAVEILVSRCYSQAAGRIRGYRVTGVRIDSNSNRIAAICLLYRIRSPDEVVDIHTGSIRYFNNFFQIIGLAYGEVDVRVAILELVSLRCIILYHSSGKEVSFGLLVIDIQRDFPVESRCILKVPAVWQSCLLGRHRCHLAVECQYANAAIFLGKVGLYRLRNTRNGGFVGIDGDIYAKSAGDYRGVYQDIPIGIQHTLILIWRTAFQECIYTGFKTCQILRG